MEDSEHAEGNGQKSQQLRYFQVKGEKWLLKLKLLILAVLCVLLGAFLVAYKVQDVLGKNSPDERFVSEKAKIIEQLQTENTNLNTTLAEKGKIIHQLQTENINLNTILKERDDKIKQLEKEKGTCDPNSQNVDELCCAVGWKYFSGKCYFFSDDKNTWTASRDACLAEGGDLVIISSPEEREFIKRSKPGPGRDLYWIGLTDAVKEGDWRWLDGTKLNNTPRYWEGSEPDNWKGNNNNEYPEGENCANMHISSSYFSLWDRLCDRQSAMCKHVCEAKTSK